MFRGRTRARRRSRSLGILGDADVVVVGERGTGLTRTKHETEGADEFYLEIARRHPGLELAARLTDPATGRVREVDRRK